MLLNQPSHLLIGLFLFPLYCCRWFTCNIVDDTVNVVNSSLTIQTDLLAELPMEVSQSQLSYRRLKW